MIKNLCIIATSTQSISAFLKKYIEEFSKSNINITIVSNFKKNQKDYVDVSFLKNFHNVKIFHISFSRKPNIFLDIISLVKLIILFRKNSFDMFFSITPKAGFISSIAGLFSKIKHRIHIFTGQVWYTKNGLVRYILKKFDQIIGILNSECLVDSFSQKEFLINEKVFKSSDANLTVVGEGSICGVDTNIFYKIDKNHKTKLKEKFKLDKDSKVIVFLGRLNKDKGVFDLAKAFDEVKKNYKKKLYLLYVGFDEQNCIDKIKQQSNNSNDMVFYNYSGNPCEYLQIADIFCLPSYREGFGLSALEAGACNLPSVTSNTVGLSDVIIQNKTGYLHEPGNVEQIKDNLLKFLNDENLCEKFGENARQRIVEKFNSNKIISSYVEYFFNISGQRNFALIGTSANSIYNFRGTFVKALKDKGYKIFAFAGSAKKKELKKIEDLKIGYTDYSVSNARFNILNEFYVMFKLLFNLRSKKPEVIFSYTLKAVIFIGILRFFGFFKKTKALAFITGVGNAFIDYDKTFKTKFVFNVCRILYQISLKNYDKILFQNNDDLQLFLNLSILKKNQLNSIVPSSGVEINLYESNKYLYPEKITFGLASRMIINKGVIEFCEAAKKVKEKFPHVEFKIVGDFEKSIYSLNYSKTIKLFQESSVKYLGWEDNIIDFYKNISVYVLPSYREGTPRSVLEAMASSRPIITTNVPGCKETVEENKNGFLIKEKNIEQLEETMIKFINDKNLIKKMGENSFQIACNKFDVKIINKKLLNEIKYVN